MLIVSKFHDYYDSALGFGGVDKTCVFKRNTIKIRDSNPFIGFLPKRIVSDVTDTVCTIFIIGFCGKLYVGGRFTNTKNPSPKNRFRAFCVYGKEAIIEVMHQKKLKEPYFYYFERKKIAAIITTFDNKSNLDLFFKYKAPIFSYTDKLILNPKLSFFEFYKVLDSYQTFQEIYMFLSGVLGEEEKKLITIPDIVRLQAKGFDKKKSFRKESTNV